MQEPLPEVTLEDIIITKELSRRSPRSPNLSSENQALHTLVRQMATQPEKLPQTVVDTAIDLCVAGSAGISLLETTSTGEDIFRWVVLAGMAKNVGFTAPKDCSFCGVCLQHGTPQLFSYPERYFSYFAAANTPIVELLVLPVIAENNVLGTVWIMSHEEQQHFDSEDVRVMASLADFAAAVLLNQRQTQDLLVKNAQLEAEVVEGKRAVVNIQEQCQTTVAQLRTSEEGLRAMIENLPGGAAFIVDRNLRYLVAEGGALCPAGFKSNDLVGKTIFEVMPPELAAYCEAMYRKALAGETFEDEHSADGNCYISKGTPLRSANGEVHAVLAVSYDISERKRAEAAVAADLEDLQLLHNLSTKLVTEGDIQTLYQEIIATAISLMRADAGSVQIFDEATQELLLLAARGFEPNMINHFYRVNASSNTSCGITLATGKRTFVNYDVSESDDPDGSSRMHVEAGYLCAQSTPLIARSGKLIGMFSTHWCKHHRPSERELRFLDLLARQAADLIEQRQTQEKLRRAANMDAFRVILSDALRPLNNSMEIQQEAMRVVGEHLAVDRVLYSKIEDDGETFVLSDNFVRGDYPKWLGRHNLSDFGRVAEPLRAGQTLVFADVEQDKKLNEAERLALLKVNIVSCIVVPLVKDGRWMFNLGVNHGTAREWKDEEIALVEEAAERMWAAIERARAEAALQEAQENLAIAVEAAQMGTWNLDLTKDVAPQRSPRHDQIFGYDTLQSEWGQQIAKRHVIEEDHEIFDAAFARAMETGELDFKVRIQWQDGSIHWMACRGHFYFDRNGKAVSGAGVNFDITDYKQAEDNRIRFIQEQAAREEERQRVESLAEIDRAKTEFFTNISHEFRTPLTLLLAPLQDALSDCDNPLSSPQRQRLQLAYGNSQRLLKLVNTLLDFSRIQANRMQAVYEPTDLAMFTTELASVFRSAIERAGLRLIVDCPPLLEPVYVDRQMWEKVVLNLLSNAFKFTLEGEITVSLRSADNHHVTLQVQDTGTGIPSEELPHLFERFYRIQNRQARTHEGSGIGLALVQELIKMHSGTVDVSSLVGEGTCFTVTIPKGTTHLPSKHIRATGSLTSNALGASPYVREAERWVDGVEGVEGVEETRGQEDREQDAPTTNYQSPIPNPQSPIPHILLVDDNADMRDYLKRILSEYVEVEAVADGAAALFAVQQRVPDLVLTDVMMPQLDGLELLKALRTDTRTREVPIILLTARAGEEFLVEGLESGTDDYLIKPFSAQELVTRVLAHLRLAQLRGEALRQEKTANRMKDRLLAEISHELNAPLVAILGWTRLLRSSPPNQAMLTKSLETIEHNATLQAKLIQDLVDMSRISTGKISLNCQQVELQAAIQIAIAAVQHSLEAKDIRLECMLASLPITVHGDPDRLQQIFLNIISNAIKFTPNGGRIEVRLDASKTQAEISVRDTGIGITAEFLPHVFEIFRQAESSRGLGIGLAIARHLVELHNGTINAQSRGIGQGATFNFTLPLIDLRKI